MILKTEILLILSIKILASHGPDVPNPVMAINWQRRGEAATRIRIKLGLPQDWQRTLKSNKLTDKTMASTRFTCNLSSYGMACSLEGFFFFIHNQIVSNKGSS